MDDKTLADLHSRLTTEREDIVVQLRDLGVSAETGAPIPGTFDGGFADSGAATAEKSEVMGLAEPILQILREIDQALVRMDNGAYGTCESCKKPIPAERLDIRPYARLCMSCKSR